MTLTKNSLNNIRDQVIISQKKLLINSWSSSKNTIFFWSNDYILGYNLVESFSLKYTIKGKYKNHTSLSYQSYYGTSDDIVNPYEEFENPGNFNETKTKK